MGLFDAILKQLVADDTSTFAAWLLNALVDIVEPLTVDDTARLSDLLRQALRVADLAALLHELSTGSESEDGRRE